jgi:translation machinery-associated protein 16
VKGTNTNQALVGIDEGRAPNFILTMRFPLLIELPDLTNGKAVKLLREWDGDTNSMTRIKTVRLHQRVPKDNSKQIQGMSIDKDQTQQTKKNKDVDMLVVEGDDVMMDTK